MIWVTIWRPEAIVLLVDGLTQMAANTIDRILCTSIVGLVCIVALYAGIIYYVGII